MIVSIRPRERSDGSAETETPPSRSPSELSPGMPMPPPVLNDVAGFGDVPPPPEKTPAIASPPTTTSTAVAPATRPLTRADTRHPDFLFDGRGGNDSASANLTKCGWAD